jgi:PiT family inorganic phosphate transporter
MDEAIIPLAVVLGLFFGWNNGSLIFGNLRGSGATSVLTAFLVSAFGLVLGVALEGSKMFSGLAGTLSPTTTDSVLLATLIVSVTFTFVLTIFSLPVSFSMVMVAAFLGATASSAITIELARSAEVILFWFAAPLVTALLTFVACNLTTRLVSGFGILAVDQFNRTGSVVSALLVSYTLGANNVGLIYGGTLEPGAPVEVAVIGAITLAALLGMVISTRSGVSGTIGDKMLSLSPQEVFIAFGASAMVVWVGTQFAIPLSISQCLLGGMFGAAYTKSIAVLNRRLVEETTSVWILAPILSFVVAYVLVPALLHPISV